MSFNNFVKPLYSTVLLLIDPLILVKLETAVHVKRWYTFTQAINSEREGIVYLMVTQDKLLHFFLCNNMSIAFINPLKHSGNFSYRFKQCYFYESTINKSASIG